MKYDELKNIKTGQKISWVFMMPELNSNDYQKHTFIVKSMKMIVNPNIDWYLDSRRKIKLAKKIIIEHKLTKKEFELIIPLDREIEENIFFTNEKGFPSDLAQINQISLEKD